MFTAMRLEESAEDFKQKLKSFEKGATAEALFDAEWEWFRLCDELKLQEDKQICGEKLLKKMEQMNLNEYTKEVYRKKING